MDYGALTPDMIGNGIIWGAFAFGALCIACAVWWEISERRRERELADFHDYFDVR